MSRYKDVKFKHVRSIEDVMKTRYEHPIMTISCLKDICRRIKILEKRK